jgi:hypothetical protein
MQPKSAKKVFIYRDGLILYFLLAVWNSIIITSKLLKGINTWVVSPKTHFV